MCVPEKDRIADVNRTHRLLGILREHDLPDEGVDIFAADSGTLLTDDELVVRANSTMIASNSEDIAEHLENPDLQYRVPFHLPEDYERIFHVNWRADMPLSTHGTCSRRSARALLGQYDEPAFFDASDYMFDWVRDCFKDHSVMGDRAPLPDGAWVTDDIFPFLPERLTLDNWVGKDVEIVAGIELTGNMVRECEIETWGPELAAETRAVDGTYVKPAGDGYILPFIGEPTLGHFVWRRDGGFEVPDTHSLRCEYVRAQKILRDAELVLLALARRIARDVARNIFYMYCCSEADEHGRPMLTRKQLTKAAREVLGEKWFALQFDDEGTQRNWLVEDVLLPDDKMVDIDHVSNELPQDYSIESAGDEVSRILTANY